MGMRELNDYVAVVVLDQPEPPRSYERKMLWHIVRDPYMVFGMCLGVLFVVGVPLATFYTQAWNNPIRVVFYAIALVVGIIALITPPLNICDWDICIRQGRIAWAEATEIQMSGEHFVGGTWVVHLSGRTVKSNSVIHATWASDIQKGSHFRVLLHPTRPEILVPIGP